MNPTLPSPYIIPGPFPIIHPPRPLPVWKYYDGSTRRFFPFARDVSLFLDAACFLRNSTDCGFVDKSAFPSARTLFVNFPEWRLDIPSLGSRDKTVKLPVTREVPDERTLFRVVQVDEHEYKFEVMNVADNEKRRWVPVPKGTIERDQLADIEAEVEVEEGMRAKL